MPVVNTKKVYPLGKSGKNESGAEWSEKWGKGS